MTKKVWAIIPARGGSVGIHKKNISLLGGKPLLAYTIEAALAARRVSEVFVSTDDADIAAVARTHGASVISRPAELSGSTATSESALLHALGTLLASQRSPSPVTVFMQCTSPFTTPDDIDGTVARVLDDGADSAFTAVPFHGFIWRESVAGLAEGVNHDQYVRQRRQERPMEYRESGAVYAFKTDGFIAHKHRFFGKILIYPTEASRGLDIDEPIDMQIAEAMLKRGV